MAIISQRITNAAKNKGFGEVRRGEKVQEEEMTMAGPGTRNNAQDNYGKRLKDNANICLQSDRIF